MSKLVQFALINHLKNNAGVSAIVGSKLFPRRLAKGEPRTPALVIRHAESEEPIAHSGSLGIVLTWIEIDCVESSEKALGVLMKAVKDAVRGYQGLMGSIQVKSVYIENEGDIEDPKYSELGEEAGLIELLIVSER